MEITRTELRTILSEVNNPTWIGFTSRTPEDMKKFLDYWIMVGEQKKKNPNPTPNPYFENGIWKVSKKYKINTGFDYIKSVNRRLEKEGKEPDFVGGFKNQIPLKDVNGKVVKDEEGNPIMVDREPWFDVISKGLVTDKKTHTKFYVRYQYLKDSVIGTPEYFYNGNPILKEMFESYLSQSENFYDNQGLDNPLMFQVCDLRHIERMSINEEQYELVD